MEKLKYIPILMYHHIIDKNSIEARNNFCIEPEVFIEQMDILVKDGYTSLNFEDLENILEGRSSAPEKPVIVTFDDAYSGTVEIAVPVMAVRKIKSVFSVVTGYIGKKSDWEKESPGCPLITKEQIKKHAGPLVSFESHSEKHKHLTDCSILDLEKELINSKKTLEAITNQKVRAVFYPYGSLNRKVKNSAAKAGYEFGLAVASSGRTVTKDRLEMRRVFIKPSDSAWTFKRKISPWYLWFRGVREGGRETKRRGYDE